MPNAETIRVIFLSAALLIFLVLGIIVASIFIAILRNVKRIAERAEETTAGVADVVQMVSKRVAPLAMSAAVMAALRKFKKGKGDSDS